MAKEKPEPEDFFGIENIPDLGDSSSNTPPPSSDNEPSLQELFVEKLLKHDQLPLTSRSPSERAKILKKRGNNPPKESEATHQNTVPLPFGHMRFDSDNEPSTGNINEQGANSIENVPKPKKSFEYRRIVPDDEVSVDEDQPTSDIAKRRVTSPNLEPVDEEAEDEIFDRRPSIQKQLPILTPRLNELNDEEILDNLENEIEHKRKLFAGRKETGSLAKINKPIKDMSSLEEGDTSDGEEISAYEEVIRMREEKERQNIQRLSSADRDGSLLALHKLWSLIPDLNKLTREEILDLLVENVLYNENELIAINKPYGLPCIGGKGIKYSLSTFLEDLRKRLAPDAKRLFLAHRIDKLTTGVLMLTTSERRFFHMKKLFAKRLLTKRYWCITRGILDPPQGTIQIPLGECEIAGHFKIIPMPHQTSENKTVVPRDIRTRFEATTVYKTLATNSGCSLVETNIITGVKHQIRSHLGLGMNCPILGDHKYSHYMKLLPQRLAPVTLHRLGIRPQKSRHLPIYLHAKEVVLPEFADSKNVFIKAPVPKFFLYTLKKLRLAK